MITKQRPDLAQLGFEVSGKGLNWKEYKYSEGDETYCMKLYNIMPGIEVYYNNYRTASHFSGEMRTCDFYELSYSHSGLYESRINFQRTLRLSAGEVMIITNVAQSYDSCMPLGFYTGFNVMFYPSLFTGYTQTFFEHFSLDVEQLFKHLMGGKSVFASSCCPQMMSVLESLFLACREGDISYIKLRLLEVLMQMSVSHAFTENCYQYISDKNFRIVQSVKEYIEQDMTKHITIKELSEIFGISQTTIKDKFKAVYGYAPYEYLKRFRMNYAAELLKTTSLSVGEIGMQIGYENSSKFSSAFCNIYGVTPLCYRKSG
ncbi:MAG: AraC family transcriptional regulator [Muricomes sp.]